MILKALLLGLCLAAYALFLRGDIMGRLVRRGWVDGGSRHAAFAVWCGKGLVLFGLIGIGTLAALRRLDALLTMPPAFAALRETVVDWFGDGRDFPILLMIGAMLAGGAIGEGIGWLRRSRKPFMLGDIGALMPRHAGEYGWGVALSVVAGVCEEIFFRLALPLLMALLTGFALAGFVGGIILFAAAHRYQGWTGVAATALVGTLMTALYLMSGALWLPMLVHGLIDLNGLVIRPALRSVLPQRP